MQNFQEVESLCSLLKNDFYVALYIISTFMPFVYDEMVSTLKELTVSGSRNLHSSWHLVYDQ